jgi:hypothetical protein
LSVYHDGFLAGKNRGLKELFAKAGDLCEKRTSSFPNAVKIFISMKHDCQ